VGRLYVDRRTDEMRIIDIALLTEYRRQGIGSRLLREILAEGQAAGLPVRIHVERHNPALRLYYRLGFRKVGDRGVYYLIEWSPDAALDPKGLRDPWGLNRTEVKHGYARQTDQRRLYSASPQRVPHPRGDPGAAGGRADRRD
jgi:RimJ/RimL family protein N-acetyltransferase